MGFVGECQMFEDVVEKEILFEQNTTITHSH